MIKKYLILFSILPILASGAGIRSHSVLSSGSWYKIGVTHTGIQKVTYENLVSLGIDPSGIVPANLRVYGNGGGMLPEKVGVERIDDLRENPILVVDGNDGSFDPGDYILFYGVESDQVKFNATTRLFYHEKNIYSDTACYFINTDLGPGKRIGTIASDTLPVNSYSNRFADFAYYDNDLTNLIRSGKTWVGEEFNDTATSHAFQFVFPNIDQSSGARFTLSTVARSELVTYYHLYVNDSLVDDIQMDFTDLDSYIYARPKVKSSLCFYPTDTLRVRLEYPLLSTASHGWLNYIEVNLQRFLVWEGPQMSFRDVNSIGPSKNTEFKIQDPAPGLTVWDITSLDSIRMVEPLQQDSIFKFRLPTPDLREFIAFDGSFFYPVNPIGPVGNQDLHGTDPARLVIITHPLFLEQAERLAAFHREHDGLTTLVVTPAKIYNEFSSGQQDVTALRDFIKMNYDKNSGQPGYVLFFGDGSYDYKNRIHGNNNMIPAFQSEESFKTSATFVTDDFYCALENGEGADAAGDLEIGAGRFPVSTAEEAREMTDKIIHYYDVTDTTFGPWKNNVTFVCDDGDNNLHFDQAEKLTKIVREKYPEFNVNKVYSDAYQIVEIPGGNRYPEANAAINKAVNDGNLVINYTGHGGETNWSEEQILTFQDINSWTNTGKLPVFVTATCEFSRFDNPERYTAGETIITKPTTGAIALYTTTRLSMAPSNFRLDSSFVLHLRETGADGKYLKIGDAVRLSKNYNLNNAYIKNWVLLGDPAMTIPFPVYRVETTEVNGEPYAATDTILGRQTVEIKGHVVDESGTVLDGFNGMVFVKVFDKPVTYSTRGNQAESYPAEFQCQNSLLFEGETAVSKGLFSFSFVVPADINLQYGDGKISYYAKTETTDATGYTNDLVIGGFDPTINLENEGPRISLYLDDRSFKDRDKTGLNTLLIADLSDTDGINSTGLGFGHEITMVLDDDESEVTVLNDYFEQDPGRYQSGTVTYPMTGLTMGMHTLTLRAWDLFNNSSEKTIHFFAYSDSSLTATNVMNFPNPFSEGTTFSITPKTGSGTIGVTIEICSLIGQPVTTLNFAYESAADGPVTYYWNGTNGNGEKLRSGLYPYRVTLTGQNGMETRTSGKLVIIR